MGVMLHFLLLIALVCCTIQGELITYDSVKGKPYTITWDKRSYLINGNRVLLLGGSVHYPRSTPAMWPLLFDMAIQNGLNTIETYVFWNLHEAERGIYDFTGRADLVQFIEQAAAHNLFVNLRIGPFVGGEWYYGGFPIWLKSIPGMKTRSFNKPFMTEMATFVTYIVNLIDAYLPSNGGNVIISQVENEYNGGDSAYVQWCGDFANSLDLGIPWMMCNGAYANNTILTYNGCYGDSWIEPHWGQQPNAPAGWTENEGWYDQWGKANLVRYTNDFAFSVASFVAYGGSYHNYYMWHGGNNYGWTSAASVTTMYANDVLVDSMALPHEPKFSFLSALHKLLQNYSSVILSQPVPTPVVNGSVRSLSYEGISFVGNYANDASATVDFEGKTYYLPFNTILIFNGNNELIFNTSDVSSSSVPHTVTVAASNFQWVSYTEPVGITLPIILRNPSPLDQLLISGYGDYAWYSTFANIASPGDLVITSSVSQSYSLYVDGKFHGANWDYTKSSDIIDITVNATNITPGNHQIDILCGSLGVDSNGVQAQSFVKGIAGDVFIGKTNITETGWWSMQGQLVGEALEIYVPSNQNLVNWTSSLPPPGTQITWYATTFTTPKTTGTVALDVTGAGKGIAYVNGNSLGRYWNLRGYCEGITWCAIYGSDCVTPTQSTYHIPPDWLTEDINTLVLFEELGAPDISSVNVVLISSQ